MACACGPPGRCSLGQGRGRRACAGDVADDRADEAECVRHLTSHLTPRVVWCLWHVAYCMLDASASATAARHDGNHGIVMNCDECADALRRAPKEPAACCVATCFASQHAVPRGGRAPSWKAKTFKSNRPLHKHIPGQAEESKPKAASEKVPPCSKANPPSRPAGASPARWIAHLGF